MYTCFRIGMKMKSDQEFILSSCNELCIVQDNLKLTHVGYFTGVLFIMSSKTIIETYDITLQCIFLKLNCSFIVFDLHHS